MKNNTHILKCKFCNHIAVQVFKFHVVYHPHFYGERYDIHEKSVQHIQKYIICNKCLMRLKNNLSDLSEKDSKENVEKMFSKKDDTIICDLGDVNTDSAALSFIEYSTKYDEY